MRGRWTIAALVALAGLGVSAGSAQACSCAPRDPGESLREADAAIIGRLLEVVPRGRLHADYRYMVKRVYRGEAIERHQVLTVRSARRSSACALPRRAGRSYGLFLAHAGGHWLGGICGVISPSRLAVAARHLPVGGPDRVGGSAGCHA